METTIWKFGGKVYYDENTFNKALKKSEDAFTCLSEKQKEKRVIQIINSLTDIEKQVLSGIRKEMTPIEKFK